MLIRWVPWLTLEGTVPAIPRPITMPAEEGIDLDGCDSITVTATIADQSPASAGVSTVKLYLMTGMSPTGPMAYVAELTGSGQPKTTTVAMTLQKGQTSLPTVVSVTLSASAFMRYLGWAIVTSGAAATDWSLSFSLSVTPRGTITTQNALRTFSDAQEMLPWTALRTNAEFFKELAQSAEGPYGYVRTEDKSNVVVEVDLLSISDGVLEIQTAFSPGSTWVTAASITALGKSTVVLTRDVGAGATALRNLVRWRLVPGSGITGAYRACARVTWGGR